jgi:RND superfamily putative drug exporter
VNKFGDFVVKRRWWILAFWLVAAILIVKLSPSLSSVESNDQSSFLPKGYESVEAINTAKKVSSDSQDATDIVVFSKVHGGTLDSADQQTISSVVHALNSDHMAHVQSVTTSAREISPNSKAQLAQVTYSGNSQDTATIDAVATVRTNLQKQLKGTDVTAGVTGGEAISYDTQGASQRALKIVGMGTLLLVLVLPALIFRSPFAGLLPIISVGIVDVIATSLIADAAKWFDFKVSQQLSVIFTVTLFGIGTDYILFLLFRYRERLRTGDHDRAAVSFALSRAGVAIFSAALVVLTSFSALFFAKFGIFSSMAPGLVICVAVMMLAALTLVPALVAVVQKKVFWPSKAWKSQSLNPTLSKKIGGVVSKHPAAVTSLVVLFLLILSAFALSYKADYSSFSQPPKGTQSASAYNTLVSAFPAGVLDPLQVYVTGNQVLTPQILAPLATKLSHTVDISNVAPAVISQNGTTALLSVTLKENPYDASAISNVAGPIRDAAHSVKIGSDHIYVGGTTAIFADMQAVTTRDLKVVFSIAGIFIFVILALLLRSLVAPVFLLLCVGIGYVATLGLTTFLFTKIGSAAGLVFFIPLFMYIFVVAVGTDYNILTITRLREEVRSGKRPREAADLTVEHSSATVASAGLILAATFGSLLLAGISFLSQMGSAIAIGVALAAFVIAPFLIPSLSAMLGYAIWWPGHRPTKEKK